jgi:hypothetical protein
MKRHNLKKVPITEIHSNHGINFREEESYKVSALKDAIKLAGRINVPLHVELETGDILQGNLRWTAAMELLKEPDITAALKANLEKLDVIYVEGLTPEERTEYILDHGSVTPLTRVETVLATWRLMKEGKNEKDIQTLLYQMYASYTGNHQYAYEAKGKYGEDRKDFLHNWLHGTLGQWVMEAGKLGTMVREQFILMDRAKDRKLTDEEKAQVRFEPNRKRVKELVKAKKEDEKGLGWSADTGGEKFNALIDQYIKEDKGEGAPKATKMSHTKMNELGDMMESPLKLAYKHCAGTLKDEEKRQVDALDVELKRLLNIQSDTRSVVDRVKIDATFTGAEVREVLRFIIGGHAADYKKYVERFCS